MKFLAKGTPNDTIQPNCSLCVDPVSSVSLVYQPCLGISEPIPNIATLVFENPAADDTRSSSEAVTHYRDTTSYSYSGTAGTLHRDTAVLNLRPNLDYGTGTTEVRFPLVPNDYTYGSTCYASKELKRTWYYMSSGWAYGSLYHNYGGWLDGGLGSGIPDFTVTEGYQQPLETGGFGSGWYVPAYEISGFVAITQGYYFSTNSLKISMVWSRDLSSIPASNTHTTAGGKNWAITKNAWVSNSDATNRIMGNDAGTLGAYQNPASLNTTGSDSFVIEATMTISNGGVVTAVATNVTGGTCTSVDARLGL